jgi:hypothetical protein
MRSTGKHQMAIGPIGGDIVAERVCVVYHPDTGEIVHIHQAVTLRGGATRAEQEIEARALELALSSVKGRDRSKMKTLLVEPKHFERFKTYKVDIKKRHLVEVKRKRQI